MLIQIMPIIFVALYIIIIVVYRYIYNIKIKRTLENPSSGGKMWPTPSFVGLFIICIILLGVTIYGAKLLTDVEEHPIQYEKLSGYDRDILLLTGKCHAQFFTIGENVDFDRYIDDNSLKGFVNQHNIACEEVQEITADSNNIAIIIVNDYYEDSGVSDTQWDDIQKYVEANQYIFAFRVLPNPGEDMHSEIKSIGYDYSSKNDTVFSLAFDSNPVRNEEDVAFEIMNKTSFLLGFLFWDYDPYNVI